MEDFTISTDGLWEYSNEGKYLIYYKDRKVTTRRTKQQAKKYIKEMTKLIEKEAAYHKGKIENILILLKDGR